MFRSVLAIALSLIPVSVSALPVQLETRDNTIIATVEQADENLSWVNYVVEDPHPPLDSQGVNVMAPYNDPPVGGFSYGVADNYPFYWDLDSCDRCPSRYLQSNRVGMFTDSPSEPNLQSGEAIVFVTHLVRIDSVDERSDRARWTVLNTFSWQLTVDGVEVIDDEISIDELTLDHQLMIRRDGGRW